MTDRNLTRQGTKLLIGCAVVLVLVGLAALRYWLGWR
jgi:hypothetical protein